jgi:hypothetical protein
MNPWLWESSPEQSALNDRVKDSDAVADDTRRAVSARVPEIAGFEDDRPESAQVVDGILVDLVQVTDGDRTVERVELVAWLENLADVDDRAFRTSERAEIRNEIKKLHAEVEKLTELTHHQREAIDKRLTEVQGCSETMGRKDWLTLAIGAAISLVIMESVPPLILWSLMVKGFAALHHLFTLDA